MNSVESVLEETDNLSGTLKKQTLNLFLKVHSDQPDLLQTQNP